MLVPLLVDKDNVGPSGLKAIQSMMVRGLQTDSLWCCLLADSHWHSITLFVTLSLCCCLVALQHFAAFCSILPAALKHVVVWSDVTLDHEDGDGYAKFNAKSNQYLCYHEILHPSVH